MPKPLSNLSDAELLAVATQTVTAMSVNPAAYGTTAPEVTALDSLVQSFTASIATSTNDNAQAKASTAVKNSDANAVVAALRNLRDGAKVAGASDAEMAATSLPFGGEKVPPSATVPVGSVDTSNRMQHTISWVEATTPDNRRRPAGAMGAEIYVINSTARSQSTNRNAPSSPSIPPRPTQRSTTAPTPAKWPTT